MSEGLTRSARGGVLLVLAGLAMSLSSATVLAQIAATSATDKVAAEALFDQARALLQKQQLSEACIKFEQSQRLDPASGTLLYLAECYERTGRTASAWATFREAASLAQEMGQTERASVGEQRATKLEPLLAKVTLAPGENKTLEGFTLARDGEAVPAALYDVPLPLDPGEHRLEASAPGYEPWTGGFTLNPADRTSVEVPMLTPQPEAAPPATAAATEPIAADAEPAPAIAADTSMPQLEPDHTWVWVLGGAGTLALGVGATFGVVALNADDKAQEFCSGERCFNTRGEELSDDAQTAALVSNVAYGVGGAALIGALWLYLTEEGGETSGATQRTLVTGAFDARGAQLGLKGSF
jgi:tetratricopeptide (TPR) repeat protein